MNFANNLKQIRKQKGLTQTELADMLGTNKTTISNYETGYSSPSLDVLREICTKLNVSADVLLDIKLNDNVITLDHPISKKLSKLSSEKLKALEKLLE